MTEQEMHEKYPGATSIIPWCEVILEEMDEGDKCLWDDLIPLGPEDALRILRDTLYEEAHLQTHVRDLAERALAQIDTRDFRNYFMAKMGMV